MTTIDNSLIMVLNPATGKMVNVKPLFDLFSHAPIMDFEEAAHCIDSAIQLIVCNYRREMEVDITDDCISLYAVRDMFTALAECEISIPKKGGML